MIHFPKYKVFLIHDMYEYGFDRRGSIVVVDKIIIFALELSVQWTASSTTNASLILFGRGV